MTDTYKGNPNLKGAGQELSFTMKAQGCILDILLEIELETGQRFTEKIFIPRAIKSY